MKKKLINIGIIISIIFSLLILTGCEKKENTNNNSATSNNTNVQSKSTVESNTTFGWIKLYIPAEFKYRPDLRGLIYKEDERKIFVNGDEKDRSTAMIIDITKEETNAYLENHINKINENINDVKYRLISEKPKLFAREKYEGKSGDTVIYNYTYKTIYNSYIYTITVSGPSAKETELNTLKDNIKASLKVGE